MERRRLFLRGAGAVALVVALAVLDVTVEGEGF